MIDLSNYPGVSIRRTKKGELRYRYRANRHAQQINLPEEPGHPGFEAAYLAAVQGVAKPKTAEVVALPGKTFGAARILLERTSMWELLDAASQSNSERYLKRFLAMQVEKGSSLTWKDAPVEGMTYRRLDALVASILKEETPAVAKFVLRDIKKLLKVALGEKWIDYDPSYGISVRPAPTDGHEPWPRHIRQQYEAYHPIGSAARTCYELGFWLGNRRSDIARVGWVHLKQNIDVETTDGELVTIPLAFDFRQKKNGKRSGGREMFLPVLPSLEAALAPLPRTTGPVLVKHNGEPFSDKALTMRMQVWTRQAGIELGYTLHGLRHTLGNYLAELGMSARQIQEVLGHAKMSASEVYVRKADKKRLSLDVYEALNEAETNRKVQVRRSAFSAVK